MRAEVLELPDFRKNSIEVYLNSKPRFNIQDCTEKARDPESCILIPSLLKFNECSHLKFNTAPYFRISQPCSNSGSFVQDPLQQ